MAYAPNHEADVFISYAHADDFAWIERLKVELENALTRKLRASVKPRIFFDSEDLRAGRGFDDIIAECLKATGFFLAIVTKRYNSSTYCRHQELGHFLKYNSQESGRIIQLQLDLSAALPLPKRLAVPFANSRGLFDPNSDDFRDSLRRVYEPIVQELDRLYAQSKIIFLAWPAATDLQEERKRLQSEVEGRGLRSYPEAIAEYQDDIQLREALQESAASVHFFGNQNDQFSERQFNLAWQVGKPMIVASRRRDEPHRGISQTAPIWLNQGNPTIGIANALDAVLGRGAREGQRLGSGLGKTRLLLVFKPEVDHTLGLRLRQRIVNHGPFEVFEPGRYSSESARYEDLSNVKGAILCWGKATKDWIETELDALKRVTERDQLYDLRRAIYLKSPSLHGNLELLEGDSILRSDADFDTFVNQLNPQCGLTAS
jgi:TIR domain